MDSDVFFQMLCKSETFVTVVAPKWPFVSVNHLMPVEIFKQSETSATGFALMGASFISYNISVKIS